MIVNTSSRLCVLEKNRIWFGAPKHTSRPTLPESNKAPEKCWPGNYFPFFMAYVQSQFACLWLNFCWYLDAFSDWNFYHKSTPGFFRVPFLDILSDLFRGWVTPIWVIKGPRSWSTNLKLTEFYVFFSTSQPLCRKPLPFWRPKNVQSIARCCWRNLCQ